VLRQAPGAKFSCSAALDTVKFAELVELAGIGTQRETGLDEFNSIYNQLIERASGHLPRASIAPQFAVENRKLLHLVSDREFPASVTALSPSDGTIKLAMIDISKWLPHVGEPQRRVTNRPPNNTSVVLWIEVGPRKALLGADLERTSSASTGWTAVLMANHSSEPATIFKVPHHGSENADVPDVWERMLCAEPIAVVTPFASSDLPKESDLLRLRSRTSNLYCTSKTTGKPPSRESMVEKMMKETVGERRVLQGPPGHVRIRWSVTVDSAPRIELFNGAYKVGSGAANPKETA
jgi:hypothetical protein